MHQRGLRHHPVQRRLPAAPARRRDPHARRAWCPRRGATEHDDAQPAREPGRLQGHHRNVRIRRERDPMRHHLTRRRAIVVTAFAVMLGSAIAWAYLTTTGAGSALGAVGKINPATNVTRQQTGADVAISWTAATLSNTGAVDG